MLSYVTCRVLGRSLRLTLIVSVSVSELENRTENFPLFFCIRAKQNGHIQSRVLHIKYGGWILLFDRQCLSTSLEVEQGAEGLQWSSAPQELVLSSLDKGMRKV